MTLGAMIVLSACASDTTTAGITPRVTAASTTTASTGSVGGQSFMPVRICVNALVDDSSAPGANFVEKVKKLSVGYSMVEPLAAAQALCNEASAQLKAEAAEGGSPSANLLASTDDINTALDLAARQIRTDGFYFGGSLPTQFIPDGATALRQAIEDFYSRASVVLR